MNAVLVANPFTGELFPVDHFVIGITLNKYHRYINQYGPHRIPWTKRNQTIIDMMLHGY